MTTLERSDFRFLPAMGYWVAPLGEVDVVVEGTEDEPNLIRLKWAGQAVADLAAIEALGRDYLRFYIDPARFEARDEWNLASVEFGMDPDDLPNTFALLFNLDGDQYGLWWVQFRFAGEPLERFFPDEFGRKQQ